MVTLLTQVAKAPKAQPYLNAYDLTILHRIFLGEPVTQLAINLGLSTTSVYNRADQMKKQLVRKYPKFIRYETGYTNSQMLKYVNQELQELVQKTEQVSKGSL